MNDLYRGVLKSYSTDILLNNAKKKKKNSENDVREWSLSLAKFVEIVQNFHGKRNSKNYEDLVSNMLPTFNKEANLLNFPRTYYYQPIYTVGNMFYNVMDKPKGHEYGYKTRVGWETQKLFLKLLKRIT